MVRTKPSKADPESSKLVDVPPPRIAALIAGYHRDPPLHENFPLRLQNGAEVPAVTVRCRDCGQPIDHNCVHGRVIDSLPMVMTLVATAFCKRCERLIVLDGRFRVFGDSFQFEHPDTHGHWRVTRKPDTPAARVRRLITKIGHYFHTDL